MDMAHKKRTYQDRGWSRVLFECHRLGRAHPHWGALGWYRTGYDVGTPSHSDCYTRSTVPRLTRLHSLKRIKGIGYCSKTQHITKPTIGLKHRHIPKLSLKHCHIPKISSKQCYIPKIGLKHQKRPQQSWYPICCAMWWCQLCIPNSKCLCSIWLWILQLRFKYITHFATTMEV